MRVAPACCDPRRKRPVIETAAAKEARLAAEAAQVGSTSHVGCKVHEMYKLCMGGSLGGRLFSGASLICPLGGS